MVSTNILSPGRGLLRFAAIVFLLVALFQVGASAEKAGGKQSVLKSGHRDLKPSSFAASALVKQVSKAETARIDIEITKDDVTFSAGKQDVLARRREIEDLLQSLTGNSSTILRRWEPRRDDAFISCRGNGCRTAWTPARPDSDDDEGKEPLTSVTAGLYVKIDDLDALQNFAGKLMDDESVKFNWVNWGLSRASKDAVKRNLRKDALDELNKLAREYEEVFEVDIVRLEDFRTDNSWEAVHGWDDDEVDALEDEDRTMHGEWKEYFKVDPQDGSAAEAPKIGQVTTSLRACCNFRTQ